MTRRKAAGHISHRFRFAAGGRIVLRLVGHQWERRPMTPGSRDRHAPPLWFRVAARARGVALPTGFLGAVVGLAGQVALSSNPLFDGVLLAGAGLLVLAFGLSVAPGAPPIAPRPVVSPVRGRWRALNSPASRVPSHGTHGRGQTFAIDLVYEPEDGARPAFGAGSGFRRPDDFPGFGQGVGAPADGRVVAAVAGAADHRSRSSWSAFAFMVVEGFVRAAGGRRHVLGNHVIIDLGDGAYAALAHLERESIAVGPGQQVCRGELIGRCGNSGNSSEPHLHLQLMDHPRPSIAAGLAFAFLDVSIEQGALEIGVPASGQVMVAGAAPQRPLSSAQTR